MKIILIYLFLCLPIFAKSEWIEPTNEVCHEFGGKSDSIYEPCLSTWSSANKICEKMNARLPTIEELENVIKECNGKVEDQEYNMKSVKYKRCCKAKGFDLSFFYWSSSKAQNRLGSYGINFEQGFSGYANDFYNLHIKCIK